MAISSRVVVFIAMEPNPTALIDTSAAFVSFFLSELPSGKAVTSMGLPFTCLK
jgi:hypothetical protein